MQSRLKKYPIVQTIHDPVRHLGMKNRLYDIVRYMELVRVDRVIVLSHRFENAFVHFGVGPERLDVIPHGSFEFDEEIWPGKCFPKPPLKKSILFAGTINKYKGLDILLRAFALVLKKHPEATLTIAGKGDLSPYLELLKKAGNVTIINRYVTEQELANLHAMSDFVVAPYIDASQSGVVSLALSNGRPVIATKVGGVPEQIDDGETGILIEPNDVHGLANAIIMLLWDREKILKLSSLAKERYSQKFGWEVIAEKTYNSCLNATQNFKLWVKENKIHNFPINLALALNLHMKRKPKINGMAKKNI